MSFNLHPQFTSVPAQQFAMNNEANQTTYTAPICTCLNFSWLFPEVAQTAPGTFQFVPRAVPKTNRKTSAVFVEPTGHTFGQSHQTPYSHHNQFNYLPNQHQNNPQHLSSNQTHYVFYHHYHDYNWTPYQQEQQEQHQPQEQQAFTTENVQQPQQQTWVPPDPYTVEQYQQLENQTIEVAPPKLDSSIVDLISDYRHDSPVQPKEQILEEIVRECEEIERRSSSGGSPNSSVWSSDERDTPDLANYHPYKTPEKKERKKAQNRLAATRYREKKRREKEEAMECIDGLSSKNGFLKDQVSELEKEISYLKKLMNEFGIEKKSQ